MFPLDDPRWNEMTCARGSAGKLPAIIQRLQHCLDEATELDRDLLGELSEIRHWRSCCTNLKPAVRSAGIVGTFSNR